MTTEFTGERVIPGQVDDDLWNEHFARYVFATQYAAGKRVLDCGCGTGYGSAELASVAQSVVGLDIARDAVENARQQVPNIMQASATALPFRAASFDLVVCFEVIEHLRGWPSLLDEVRRVLAPDGQLIVSTPNKSFYADARKHTGPNPFHEHEFEFEEFREALESRFKGVTILAQDHVESIVFRGEGATAAARLGPSTEPVTEAAYFVAVCGAEAEPFVYVPRAANALREKTVHIEQLERFLAEEQTSHQELLRQHAALQAELERNNRWAAELTAKLDERGERVVTLQNAYADLQRQATEAIEGYENEIARQAAQIDAASQREARLEIETRGIAADRDRQTAELGRCVELLNRAEALVAERTQWAQSLEARLNEAGTSKWLRLGRALRVGPELESR